MADIVPGTLLIADPFLKDPNFMRSVIIICEHQPEGSFGFVVNRAFTYSVGQLVDQLKHCDFPIHYGGPVQADTVHYIHMRPDLLAGCLKIANGIYWGGDLDELGDLIRDGEMKESEIKFYLGYSGWSKGQLQQEIETKSWILSEANKNMIFKQEANGMWSEALKNLGGEYEQMKNYPIDPQLN